MRPGGDWKEQNWHVSMVNIVKGHNVIACKCLYENHNCVCWVYVNQNIQNIWELIAAQINEHTYMVMTIK